MGSEPASADGPSCLLCPLSSELGLTLSLQAAHQKPEESDQAWASNTLKLLLWGILKILTEQVRQVPGEQQAEIIPLTG